MSKKIKVEKIEDIRKKELKLMEKRLKELEIYKYGENSDGKRDYDKQNEYASLPEFARKAVDREIHDLKIKLRMMASSVDSINNDLRDAINNVLKYYGVEKNAADIEERFNQYYFRPEDFRLDKLISVLADKVSERVDRKISRDFYY